MPRVNPEIMVWAREEAGLVPGDDIQKLSIREAWGVPPLDRLAAIENGETEPTRPMLVKMAKAYRRPLVTFYMSRPPVKGDRGEDFRTLPDDYAVEADAILDTLLRDIRARQSMVRAVLEDEDEAKPLPFVASKAITDRFHDVAVSIRDTLDFELNAYRQSATVEQAFAYLREKAEDAGVYVILVGNLGSHHTAIDAKIFRGFAIADEVAPFIIVNDQDAKPAWTFTLLHELTHIWLGQTGVSGASAERNIEKFCNDVAGELLLPAAELRQLAAAIGQGFNETAAVIVEFARTRKISRTMVAYKLFRNDLIDDQAWQGLTNLFRDQWRQNRAAERVRAREGDGGPNYYVVRRHRIGAALIDLVRRMTASGALTTSKAGKVLGVKPKNVEPMISRQPANNLPGA